MMIHEMKQVVWVTNETLGDGIIMAILDYGAHHNSVLMVGFESGDIKFLDTNQVKLTRNDTLGIGAMEQGFREPKMGLDEARTTRDLARLGDRLHSLEVKSTLLDDILRRLTKLEKQAKQPK